MWAGLKEGHEAPAQDTQWAMSPVSPYWRFGDGDRETYLLNQILSAMDRRQAKHKERDNTCFSMFPFLQVAK